MFSKLIKSVFAITLIIFAIYSTSAAAGNELKGNPNYDQELAKQLGADDYGMKSYVFVVLKSGDKSSTKGEVDSVEDKKAKQQAFAGHMENINRLVDQGKLIVAGPFGKNNNDFRGLFILDVESIEQAEKLLQSDPAIKQRYLKAELYPWYGSAALPQYLDDADKVWKASP